MNAKTEAARRQMIDQQVRTWDVLDARVLDALGAIPREKFVPEAYRGVAFADAPIPIGHGQFMLPPALEGRILQALAPVRGERALEIGTGSGFFAACLAHLTGSVDSIEIHADLAAGAARAIGEQGISRISDRDGRCVRARIRRRLRSRRHHGRTAGAANRASNARWWWAVECSS